MLGINLLAFSCCIAGFAVGWNLIRKRRLPFEADNALVSWKENPPSAFQYDRFAAVGMAVHAASIVLLSALLLGAVNRAAPHPWSLDFRSPGGQWLESVVGIEDPQMRRLSMVAASIAAGMAGFTLGAFVSFPIVRWRVRPIRVHIVSSGIIYGSTYSPWSEIGHWQADQDRHLIWLFSKARPRVLSVILHPPTAEAFAAVEGQIQALVPGGRVPLKATWDRQRRVFAWAFFPGILAMLLVAFWARSYVAEWVWLLLGVEIVALELAGQLLSAV